MYQFFIDNPDLYDKENEDGDEEKDIQDYLNNWVKYALEELKMES